MLLCGLTDKDLRRICWSQYEHPGSAIGYLPETCLGHVYIVLEPVGSARLTFRDDRYYEFMCFDVPKIVRSLGCDHGHDEESRNGRDIKIDILDDYVWTSEVFRASSGIYRSTGGYRNPPGSKMGLMGLSGKEKGLPKVGRAPLPSLGPNRTRRGGRPPSLFSPLRESYSL